jgi:hypothetical protein
MSRVRVGSEVPVAQQPVNLRWSLERQVKAARIPAPAKLIMFTLMTCLGPASLDLGKWSPGMRKLAAETSLNIHTVVRYVALLESHDWLSRRLSKGRRTEYVLSSGREFTEPGKPGNLPGVATPSNTTVATGGNTTVATPSNTFRTCSDQETDLSHEQDQVFSEEDERQAPEQGRSPANTAEDICGVLLGVATVTEAAPLAGPLPLDRARLIAGLTL